MGVKKIQNVTPPTDRNQSFQTCPEFSCQWSSQDHVGIFDILSFRFYRFFFKNFKYTIVVYG